MADIAFLLLVFFLVTTTMDQQKGLRVQLPPYPDPNVPPPVVEQNDRNVLEVLVNSADQLLVERKPLRLEALTDLTKSTSKTKEDFLTSPTHHKLQLFL